MESYSLRCVACGIRVPVPEDPAKAGLSDANFASWKAHAESCEKWQESERKGRELQALRDAESREFKALCALDDALRAIRGTTDATLLKELLRLKQRAEKRHKTACEKTMRGY